MARGYSSAPGASPEVAEASKPDLDRESITAHGTSKDPVVREVIAGRLDCPVGLMIVLAHDRVADVRCAVAANPAALRAVLEHLAEDRVASVLVALARNPSLGGHVLERLAVHKTMAVSVAAARALESARGASGPVIEDSATPELRDSGFTSVNPGGPRVNGGQDRIPQLEPKPPREPLTRTAPVRGFKTKED